MKLFYFITILLFGYAHLAPAAGFPVRNGRLDINVAGGNAGSVNLNLSYANPEKTEVKLEGGGLYEGRNYVISERHSLSALKQIVIDARGSDGQDGYDGRDGYSGSDGSSGWSGSNGSDGCPPGDGGDGSNGSDGTDGGDGSDGGDGTNGGDGGKVKITVPADQSELLLLVKGAYVAGGSRGRGGSGGSGGSGGRGGSGGSGGSGGANTCKNDKGEHVGGPSGRSGSSGWNGRDGSGGRGGSDGRDGYDGNDGTLVFTTTDAAGAHDYAAPFKLNITGVKAVDDNEDTVVQPGEKVHITEITVANSGPMPSPANTAMVLNFASNSTLEAKIAASIAMPELIPGGGSKTLSFSKGQLVFQTPHKAELVGKSALLSTKLTINSFAIEGADATGLSIHWPVGLNSAQDSAGVYFGSARALNYTIKNVSTKDVGPTSSQPVDVEFAWVSKEVPGADVTVTLKDGRTFQLGQPYTISDFTIAAKSALAIPVSLLAKNSKSVLSTSGALKITLKLKDYTSDGKDAVDSSSTALSIVKDFRPEAFNKTYDTSKYKIECRFPRRLLKTLDISEVAFAKNANSDSVRLRISRKGFLSNGTSPVVTTNAFDFAPHGALLKTGSVASILSFLNKIITPALNKLAKQDDTWHIQPGSCLVKKR